MATQPAQLHFHSSGRSTEGEATNVPPTPTAASDQLHREARTREPQSEGPSAQQIEDLNFYLRRMTVAGNGDISQIENFGGGPDYEMFLDAVTSLGVRYGWSEAEMLRTVEFKLKDKAREYYGALLPSERPRSMIEMKQWFRRVFGRKLTISAGKRELERCVRMPGEPLGEYAQRLKVIANKMFPMDALTTPEKLYHRNLILVNQFVEGLDRRLANEILRVGEFYKIDDCLEVAEECEEVVSRMIPETRHDFIRRVETTTDESVRRNPNWSEERFSEEPRTVQRTNNGERNRGGFNQYHQRRTSENGNQPPRSSKTQFANGETRRGTGTRRGDQQERGYLDNAFLQKFPYMRRRCRKCGQEGHTVTGCLQQRVLFCYHCGKVGEICDLNSQRPRTQNNP